MRSNLALRPAATVLALLGCLCWAAWLLVHGRTGAALLPLPLVLWLLRDLYRSQTLVEAELAQFTEAIRYRDFSQQYGRRATRPELQALHASFQEINAAFRTLTQEKETQYQHLQNILELITTGILSYELSTGTVYWLNEALKEQLRLPHLKNISGLARRLPELAALLADLRPGSPQVATVPLRSGTLRLLLSATIFQTRGQQYKLVAAQNIGPALDETEADAWQKLLRVLTHEIMNSVAPIASLAETLLAQLRADGSAGLDAETREDLELGIDTIKRRSDGLLQFATTYRSLSKIAAPILQALPVAELFETIEHLLLPTLQDKGIRLELVLPDPQLTLQADRVLLEQVLINLVVNAVDAVSSQPNPSITLTAAATSAGTALISVADNGSGMGADVLDKAFIPFFTTKKNGSGIGLSLCKQIILLHKGSMQIHSEPGKGTIVSLLLR
jgi:signal transduction histidine kinase